MKVCDSVYETPPVEVHPVTRDVETQVERKHSGPLLDIQRLRWHGLRCVTKTQRQETSCNGEVTPCSGTHREQGDGVGV